MAMKKMTKLKAAIDVEEKGKERHNKEKQEIELKTRSKGKKVMQILK